MVSDVVDLQTLRNMVAERVVAKYPRLRHRVIYQGEKADSTLPVNPHGMLPSEWVIDPNFSIERQVVLVDEVVEDNHQLQLLVARITGEELPRDRPQWQYLLVPRFGQNQSAILFRAHHVIADGIALAKLLINSMDAGVKVSTAEVGVKSSRSYAAMLFWPIRLFFALVNFLVHLLFPSDHNLFHPLQLTGVRHVAWTDDIDFKCVRDAKSKHEVTVNDLLMSCLAGSLGRYIQHKTSQPQAGNFPLANQLRVVVPMSFRMFSKNAADVLDNQFCVVVVPLPLQTTDRIKRLQSVKRTMDRLKRSVAPLLNYILVYLVGYLPRFLSRFLIHRFANRCSAVVTNVPGPDSIVTVHGRSIHSMMFWVPALSDIGLGLSILTYAGKLRVGVTMDQAIGDDPSLITSFFQKELEEYCQ
eukprot:TRINITY_DN11801_c0_g1_i11.p1 TRINITY_DN11801_c0_g1~~TRINITY_DN11801_c0_g1_i11.p1  ORF type:complete len:414 (+),score=56.01 TRINITY_DN11801_c0_g1_i11:113-1354(+)